MFVKEFAKVLFGDTNMDVIIYLHGYANAVAFSDAEAAREGKLVLLDVMLGDSRLKKLYNILRALEVAGRSNTNLNEQHGFIPLRELRY